jgi:hypothetical protein
MSSGLLETLFAFLFEPSARLLRSAEGSFLFLRGSLLRRESWTCSFCVSCRFEVLPNRAILGLAIAGVGNLTTTMTKEARPLTQEQRKEFVQLLKEAKTRVLEGLSNRWSKRHAKAWKVAVDSLMEKLGAKNEFEKIMAAQKDLKDSEKKLKAVGFKFDDEGDLELTSEGSKLYDSELSDKQSEIMEAEVESVRKSYSFLSHLNTRVELRTQLVVLSWY